MNDHISKTKNCQNRKMNFSFVSEHCATFWTKKRKMALFKGRWGHWVCMSLTRKNPIRVAYILIGNLWTNYIIFFSYFFIFYLSGHVISTCWCRNVIRFLLPVGVNCKPRPCADRTMLRHNRLGWVCAIRVTRNPQGFDISFTAKLLD